MVNSRRRNPMRITFVKKILADGTPCAKCADVEARLVDAGRMSRIDRVVIADERDPESEGMRLARRHGVATAPFFIVEDSAPPERPVAVEDRPQPSRQGQPAYEHPDGSGSPAGLAIGQTDSLVAKTTIYTVYLKFVRDVFGPNPDSVAEAREAIRADPDLGLI